MKDIRSNVVVKLEPSPHQLATKEAVLAEAERTNWRSDGEKGEHLWQRRLAMGEVIEHCVGYGLDVGCQANKIIPGDAVNAVCIGIDHDRRPEFMDPRSRWTCDEWGNGLALKWPNNAFDWLFAGHVLEDQAYPTDALKMLGEFHRVVKHEGLIILLMPHGDYYPHAGTPEANPSHTRDWWPRTLNDFYQSVYQNDVLIQLETFVNKFEFDAVYRVSKA